MVASAIAAAVVEISPSGRPCVHYGRNKIGPNTPWGAADTVTTYAPGVEFYSTSEHGGFKLSEERQGALERLWPEAGELVAGAWFEEDCGWAVVALAFPSLFEAKDIAFAAKIVRAMPKIIANGVEVQAARGNAVYVRRQEQRLVGWRVLGEWLDDEGQEYLQPYLDREAAVA